MVDNPDNPDNSDNPDNPEELNKKLSENASEAEVSKDDPSEEAPLEEEPSEDAVSEEEPLEEEISDEDDSEGGSSDEAYSEETFSDEGAEDSYQEDAEKVFEEEESYYESVDQLDAAEMAYRLEWRWAGFELAFISPTFPSISPPHVIPPEDVLEKDGLEFVYPIHDYGYKMSVSKAQDMLSAGMSMCKLYNTIEKMVYLLIERLKATGIGTDTEVQVSFNGFILPQRKAFESIINLNYNVVVTNFEPGDWGEQYLRTIKRIADKGYGYPPEAPRDSYRHHTSTTRPGKK